MVSGSGDRDILFVRTARALFFQSSHSTACMELYMVQFFLTKRNSHNPKALFEICVMSCRRCNSLECNTGDVENDLCVWVLSHDC